MRRRRAEGWWVGVRVRARGGGVRVRARGGGVKVRIRVGVRVRVRVRRGGVRVRVRGGGVGVRAGGGGGVPHTGSAQGRGPRRGGGPRGGPPPELRQCAGQDGTQKPLSVAPAPQDPEEGPGRPPHVRLLCAKSVKPDDL